MTVLAGILADDGAVVAADTLMTTTNLGGGAVAGHQTKKIVAVLGGAFVIALTGETGAGGRICEKLQTHYKSGLGDTTVTALEDHEYAKWLFRPVRNAATADGVFLNGLATRFAKAPESEAGRVAAFLSHALRRRVGAGFALLPRNGSALLARFEGTDIVEVHRQDVEFAFLGSGQKEAEVFFHFLRTLLFPGRLPTLAQAEFAAYWSIQHCIDVNSQGVGGRPHLATLRHGDAAPSVLDEARLSEHAEMLKELRGRFAAQFMDATRGVGDLGPIAAATGTLPSALKPDGGKSSE